MPSSVLFQQVIKTIQILIERNKARLYKNKLYKCAPIANLLDLPNTKGYKYNPVGSYDQLDKFVERIGKPESICSMCPESRSHAIDHYKKGEVLVKHLD